MCLVEIKTYVYSSGRRQTIEKQHLCSRAAGAQLCRNVTQRTLEPAHIVEIRPTSSTAGGDVGSIPTPENLRRRAKNLSDRSGASSNRSSTQRHSGTSFASPVSIASSTSSPPLFEARPSSEREDLAEETMAPFQERQRMPYPPPEPSEPGRTVLNDGTAVYDVPPSLTTPRALHNERRASSRRSPPTTTPAHTDELPRPNLSNRRNRPSIGTDNNIRQPAENPQRAERTPRESARTSHRRQDSARASGTWDSHEGRARDDTEHRRRQEQRQDAAREHIRRSRTSDRARSTHRQSLREEDLDAHEARSRDRHRAEAEAALEGRRLRREQDSIANHREAELAQMAWERAVARQRELDAQQYYDWRIRRDTEALAQRRPHLSARRFTGDDFGYLQPSRISARSPTMPIVHHLPSARRNSISIGERGEDIISRERARVAHERMVDAFDVLGIEDEVVDDDEFIDDYARDPWLDRRMSHRTAGRDGRRRRHEEFWR